MKINFDDLPLTILEKFYGGNGVLQANMYVDESGKILRGKLVKGSSIGMHTHETSAEVIFITSGKGVAICDGVVESLQKGDCHYCKKGGTHTLINEGEEDLSFLAVVR